jgi:hypothetical protein
VKVSREQALAFRLARHHLTERTTPLEAAVVGLQDTPPGAAGTAFAARADGGPDALAALLVVPSLRGAPMAIDPADQALFTEGIAPPDEEAAKVVVGNAWKTLEEHTAMDALDIASEAVRDALAQGPLPKSEFHKAITERVPRGLRWWCKNCDEHHLHPSLWRATGIRGVLAVVGRDGRTPVYGAPPEPPHVDDPGAELARRFLHAYAPARPKLLADWAGISTAHATQLWERAGELAEVELDGRKAWAPAEDLDALAGWTGRAGTPSRGVRLLPSLDPLAGSKDHELIAPDKAVRQRIWTSLGGAGMVLAGGALAGTWRPAKKGSRLVVTVDAAGVDEGELAAEAERLAPFRGAQTAEIARA